MEGGRAPPPVWETQALTWALDTVEGWQVRSVAGLHAPPWPYRCHSPGVLSRALSPEMCPAVG